MSTSPCCTSYKFPPSPRDLSRSDKSDDYFAIKGDDVNDTMRDLTVNSPLMSLGSDYFHVASPSTQFSASELHHPHQYVSTHEAHQSHDMRPPLAKSKAKVGCSSISSLTSESTLVGHSSSNLLADFYTSSETLVGGTPSTSTPSGQHKNPLLLTLTVPKRSYQQPHTANAMSNINEPLYEYDEDDWQKSRSAVNPFFNLKGSSFPSPQGVMPSPKPPVLKGSTSFSAVNGSRDTKTPLLKKHSTLSDVHHPNDFVASIKSEQVKRLHSAPAPESFAEPIMSLSNRIKYVGIDTIKDILSSACVDEQTRLPTALVIDVRSFADNVKCHIRGSLNVCLPLTLLKRTNFNLLRCINSLPAYEKTILQTYIHHNEQNKINNVTFSYPERGVFGLPPVIIYDNNNSSSNLYHMCKKLTDTSCWDQNSCPPIYLMNDSFSTFQYLCPELVSSGKEEDIDINQLAVKPVRFSVGQPRVPAKSSSFTNGTTTHTENTHPKSNSISGGVLTASGSGPDTPISNFKLPQNLPVSRFKIRHNEEVFDNFLSPMNETFSLSKLDEEEFSKLPYWLQCVEKDNSIINKEFNRLEQLERNRLNGALSVTSCGSERIITPGGTVEECPQINCGLDFGHKNRYKDIFLFDHSRVKLNDFSKVRHSRHDSNYINASYLNPISNIEDFIDPKSNRLDSSSGHMKYIATQGPLMETIGDFWRCVTNQGCLLIVSLSDEVENGVHKCSAFWREGVYKSGECIVNVELKDEESHGNFHLRLFRVTIDGHIEHEVLQVHLAKWEDMSTLAKPDDLLDLVALKRFIIGNVPVLSEYPTLTHCSAGCGRTGVFCVVDSVISLVEKNGNYYDLSRNPIYELVNNLRRQRISMVQTMRQYYFIYDALAQHALYGSRGTLLSRKIVKDFIMRRNLDAQQHCK